MKNYRIAILQICSGDTESMEKRIDRVVSLIEEMSEVDLVILPELWINGAFVKRKLNSIENEINLSKAFTKLVPDLCRQTGASIHIGSIVESKNSKFYNTSLIFNSEGILKSKYSKMHLFLNEKYFFEAGVETGTYVDKWGTRICPLICFDLRFPEQFRSIENFGSEMYLISSAWPESRLDHWSSLLKSRAIENQSFVIGCNGVGTQQEVVLGGCSTIYDPWGKNVVTLGKDEELVKYTIDLDAVKITRHAFPLRD